MSSKPKNASERFMGKSITLVNGSIITVSKVENDCISYLIDTLESTIPISKIEARGGRFFETTETITEVALVSTETKELDDSVQKMITCQYCIHSYDPELGGSQKPQDSSNACQDCLTLAEDRLLAKGIPGHEVTLSLCFEYLANFYGIVNHDININIKKDIVSDETTKLLIINEPVIKESSCKECTCQEEQHIDFESSLQEFLYARKQLAQTLVDVINKVSGNASVGEETEDAITLILEPFDFELTALCGGFIVSTNEEGRRITSEEFVNLDELFSYFCGEVGESTIEEIPDSEDSDTLEEEELVDPRLNTFQRLQNCKKEELNKRLVYVTEIDTDGTFHVIDKMGKKYKVPESKLKPSIKSFSLN